MAGAVWITDLYPLHGRDASSSRKLKIALEEVTGSDYVINSLSMLLGEYGRAFRLDTMPLIHVLEAF